MGHADTMKVSTAGEQPLPDPGYYPDPENPGMERWWNGQAWSEARRYVQAPEVRHPSPEGWRNFPIRVMKFKEGTPRNKAIGTAMFLSMFPVSAVVSVIYIGFPLPTAILLSVITGSLAYGAWVNALKIPR